MDIREYNGEAWDGLVDKGNRWTVPVVPEVISAARRGEWQVYLTPAIVVPRPWFPPLDGRRVLGLASGGGQQGPILAAAGAHVTVLDYSSKQLAQDQLVAQRDSLAVDTVQGDMADLSAFDDGIFDLVFHPCSNGFAADVRVVWRECFRVMRPGGVLMCGFSNPAQFIFDALRLEKGEFLVRHKLPYSELTDLTDAERQEFIDRGEPLMFGHTLDDQIGGQLAAGFHMTDFFEDTDSDSALSAYMQMYIATRAIKPE
jgi:SAM-dependent methyltransferase